MKIFLRICLVLILVIGMYLFSGLFSSKPPTPIVTIDNKVVSTAQASYCWNGFLKSECVDTISPPEIIKHHSLKAIVVSAEAKVKVEFKNEPLEDTLTASIWNQDQQLESAVIHNHLLTAPKEKGVYVYDIFARWEKGDSSNVFVLEVE